MECNLVRRLNTNQTPNRSPPPAQPAEQRPNNVAAPCPRHFALPEHRQLPPQPRLDLRAQRDLPRIHHHGRIQLTVAGREQVRAGETALDYCGGLGGLWRAFADASVFFMLARVTV